MRKKLDGKRAIFDIVGYIYITLIAVLCFIPFWLVLSGSFTKESVIMDNGFSIIPKALSLQAYEIIFLYPDRILRAYEISISLLVLGTGIGLFLLTMAAFVLTRKDFKYRNFFSFFFYFTTLFGGGLVPFYLLIVIYLHLKNNFLAMLLPSLMGAMLILLMRNFLKSIPESMIESTQIDGAGYFLIFLKFILPLSKSGLATIGLFLALGYWNDWFLAMMFIEDTKLHPLQYMLYQILQSVEGLRTANARGAVVTTELPSESIKMATAVVATGPIILAYPYIQRFFVKGLTIGAVKG